jgi:hypothetical protein
MQAIGWEPMRQYEEIGTLGPPLTRKSIERLANAFCCKRVEMRAALRPM